MISRAARVPRICLACRFGLITQRSTALGFRPSPVREGLGRRLYTSDIGNARDYKVDPLTTAPDTLETKSEQKEVVEEPTESKDATSTTNSPPATETDSAPTQRSEGPQVGENLNSDPDLRSEYPIPAGLGELEDMMDFTRRNSGMLKLPELSELSSRQPSGSAQFDLDKLLDESSTRKIKNPEFEVSEFSEFEDDMKEFQDGFRDDRMPLPKSQFRDRLMHDESLGVPTLGLPADAIIINNPNRTRIERPAPTIMKAEPMEHATVDWAKLVNENVEPETEEIIANIEEVRPDSRILRLADIEKLLEALCSGFTIAQLREYHSVREPESKDPDFVDYHWISETIPWASVNSFRPRGSDKTTLAQKIVFDKWKIEAQEHEDDLGKAFIWMDPNIFPFLTYGPNNIGRLLWELRRDFLISEDEKLTLHTPNCRLNITAKKSTAYGILAYINQAVERMKSRVIDITPYLSKDSNKPSAAELKELGRLTKTTIERVKEGNQEKFLVTWMPKPDETPTETEDLADTVFRLLVGRVVPGSHSSLQCIPSQGEDDLSAALVQVQRQTRAMSWRDKLNKWLRVAAPIEKSTQEPSPLNLRTAADLPDTKIPPAGNKDATTATFGHILHSEASTSIESLSRKRRILAPLTPHPAAFSALEPNDHQPLKETTTIVMHLVPHVDSNEGRGGANKKSVEDPAVCIRIPVHPDADLANFEIPKDMAVECYIPWHINDLLLPTEAVDVRLEHKRSYALKVGHLGLREFLKTSQLNLLEGELRTPSQATLSIPGSWVRGSLSGSNNTKRRDVLYEFRGTEIHQTVEMPWRGHTLRYSSIEAGQHGGQRQEITLQAGTPNEKQAPFLGNRRATFLDLVEDMATGKCFSWFEGSKSIKSRQLEDYSYNLPEEELTEDIIVDKDKFDSRGRVKQPENRTRLTKERKEKKQPKQQPPEQATFDDIDAMLAAKDNPTPKIKTNNTPRPAHEVPIVPGGITDDLMKFIDEHGRPKNPVDENSNQVYGTDGASHSNSASEETRQEVLNELFTISEPSAAPEKSTTKKSAAKKTSKAKTKSSKYALPDLPEKPKKKAVDEFAAQFASRITGKNKAPAESDAVVGFFDTLSKEVKEKDKKQNDSRRGRSKKGKQ